ncbi:hypothetical protein EJ06DRAFT_527459 [Trichodelitschia bisporula]|uniref:Mid2 domain-containing protein n=1 Tax=Trichodelitschia bisporula TaxID=703511 RepID=A0A6G1I6H3_9PEZI|nr:hypothetical protein EJ06DRAFT_527459 [Trichodelitschia bisporula]
MWYSPALLAFLASITLTPQPVAGAGLKARQLSEAASTASTPASDASATPSSDGAATTAGPDLVIVGLPSDQAAALASVIQSLDPTVSLEVIVSNDGSVSVLQPSSLADAVSAESQTLFTPSAFASMAISTAMPTMPSSATPSSLVVSFSTLSLTSTSSTTSSASSSTSSSTTSSSTSTSASSSSSSSSTPTGVPLPAQTSQPSHAIPGHVIAGVVIGIVSAAILTVAAAIYFLRRRRPQPRPSSPGVYPQEAFLYDPPVTPPPEPANIPSGPTAYTPYAPKAGVGNRRPEMQSLLPTGNGFRPNSGFDFGTGTNGGAYPGSAPFVPAMTSASGAAAMAARRGRRRSGSVGTYAPIYEEVDLADGGEPFVDDPGEGSSRMGSRRGSMGQNGGRPNLGLDPPVKPFGYVRPNEEVSPRMRELRRTWGWQE